MSFPFLTNLTIRPGYKALAQLIIGAIETGKLPAASLLPPSRALSQTLGISRDTVIRCYKHLQSLGYIDSHGTRGMHVRIGKRLDVEGKSDMNVSDLGDLGNLSDITDLRYLRNLSGQHPEKQRLSVYGASMIETSDMHSIAPDFPTLNYGAVPATSLPLRRWRELMQTHSQPASMRNLRYDMEVLGRGELRQALSGFVNRSKGMNCDPQDIAVFNLSFTAYTLICRLIMNPGDVMAVEEPGFGGIKNVASYLGINVFPVPIDNEGLIVDKLNQSERPIKLVYVSPDHQEPTGVTMSLLRRKQLLAWAEENDAWILEDDYDGFFHYGKQPPPNISSLDHGSRVIYFATFWQLLYPLTTLCFVAVPPSFMSILTRSKIQTEGITETMVQLAVSDLLDSGFLQKHARKLERIFAAKRRALMYELKRVFSKRIQIPKHTGGTTCFLQFSGWSDQEILDAAKAAHLPLLSALYYYGGQAPGGQFIAYFAGLGEEREIKKIVESFAFNLGQLV